MPDAVKQLLDSGPIRLALFSFAVGIAWADLHAQIRENKLEADARFAMIATDIHAMKVLACLSHPRDSVCAVP